MRCYIKCFVLQGLRQEKNAAYWNLIYAHALPLARMEILEAVNAFITWKRIPQNILNV